MTVKLDSDDIFNMPFVTLEQKAAYYEASKRRIAALLAKCDDLNVILSGKTHYYNNDPEIIKKCEELERQNAWNDIETLPENQANVWCKFHSGAKIHARFLQGQFCWYDFSQDRYIQIENWNNPKTGIKSWKYIEEIGGAK